MMNHLWDISIYQIQIFLKAAEFRSFSLAAAHLNTTQSTVSKSIAATEAALGFALFIRTRSGVELTLSGARLFDQWKNLVSSMESSYHKVSSEFLHGIQILRVGIPDSFADGEELLVQVDTADFALRRPWDASDSGIGVLHQSSWLTFS